MIGNPYGIYGTIILSMKRSLGLGRSSAELQTSSLNPMILTLGHFRVCLPTLLSSFGRMKVSSSRLNVNDMYSLTRRDPSAIFYRPGLTYIVLGARKMMHDIDIVVFPNFSP